jgi:hypothetical protein
MAAGVHDILVEQGATFSMTLTLKDENKDSIDLSGLTFRGKIKKAFTDTTSQADFNFNVLNQSNAATKGKVEVSLTAAQTASISAPTKGASRTLTIMVYDIESESPTGQVVRWLQGDVSVSPEVTK